MDVIQQAVRHGRLLAVRDPGDFRLHQAKEKFSTHAKDFGEFDQLAREWRQQLFLELADGGVVHAGPFRQLA